MTTWLIRKRKFLFGILSGSIVMLLIGQSFICSKSDFTPQIDNLQPRNTKSGLSHSNSESVATKHAISKTENEVPNLKKRMNISKTNSSMQCASCQQDLKVHETAKMLLSVSELMETTQKERISTIRRTCQTYFPETSSCNKDKRKYIHEYNLVSRNYKLIVCDIPKCGYSSWLAAINVMENIYTVDDYKRRKIQGKKVVLAANKLRLSEIKNKTLKEELWRESLKVLMVRNPFSKIVSVYYDKFLTTSPGFSAVFEALSFKINQQFRNRRQNISERDQIGDGTATFEDFVNYLLTHNIMRIDPHLRSYLARCKPCETDYNYLVKFETLQNDMEYLKLKLNVSEYHRQAVFPRRDFKTNEDLVKKTFKKIPKELAVKLYKKFKKDFEIFGYEKPEWLCDQKQNWIIQLLNIIMYCIKFFF